ncbi:isochorismatase family protein [Stackebrandtia albiflava]|nr:isochorismatase family protein [Stackebrandtia albiflava]
MAKTSEEPRRDPAGDGLLAPGNCVLALIDFQPGQYATVRSSPVELIDLNVRALCELATAFEVPVVLSTVGVDMGVNEGTVDFIRRALTGVEEIDRTGVNAWEDADFRAAVEATGRSRVVVAGLWTEVCVTFPTLDMLAAGYRVYPVVDAIGGVSETAHRAAIGRMTQAGASPVTAVGWGCELMRNWARPEADGLRRVMSWYFPRLRELSDTR